MLSIVNGAGSRQASVPIENIPKVLKVRSFGGDSTQLATHF